MTSLLSKSIRILRLAAALLLLPVLGVSCQMMKEDFADEMPVADAPRYINISVSVSASANALTRAYPIGGETGDGLEKGQEWENAVDNITLIFFQDATDGINTQSDDVKALFVKKYAVHRINPSDLPNAHDHTTDGWTGENDDLEVIYSTGDQRLDETDLEVGQSYQVIVVANADPLVVKGDKIKDVREKVRNVVYTKSGVGTNAADFVMASERDATIRLANPVVNTTENRYTYYFDCIHMERLAARIDFLTTYGGQKKAATDDTPATDNTQATWTSGKYSDGTTSLSGYEYTLFSDATEADPTSNDHFLVVGFTPFNVSDGQEFFVKRTNDAQKPYLRQETTTSWVRDPYSYAAANADKTTAAYPDHITQRLENLTTVEGVTASIRHLPLTAQSGIKIGGVDNVIVGYVKENTITAATPLFYYATGLAIEGYYFRNGTTTGGEHMVLYTFLRHQGEATVNEPYDAFTFSFKADKKRQKTLDEVKAMKCKENVAMNFGVVRNNIYRVSINRIVKADDAPEVTLHIKVKKWDKFVHIPIYM